MSAHQDRKIKARFRLGLRAIVFPTHKGDPEAMKLIIQDGQGYYYEEPRTVADTVGQLDGKVKETIESLGYELIGDDNLGLPNAWVPREGAYQHLLRRKE